MASKVHFTSAKDGFRRARNQASIHTILSHLTGKQDDLLSYDEVRKSLGHTEISGRNLKEIPIDAIKGSVNRYSDITSNFLPRRTIDAQRWARVKAASGSLIGLPPIEVYQIGDIFFVQDGNHRVSIARQAEHTHIQAYVKEVNTRIHLAGDIQPDDLIIRTEYLDFLRRTNFDCIFPNTQLVTTSPGKIIIIQQQIEAIHFLLEMKKNTKVSLENAVIYWYNKVYMPIIDVLRAREMIKEFPSRTETDLYIWIIKYQSELAENYGWKISPETSTKRLLEKYGQQSKQINNIVRKLYQNWIYGPTTGKWREERLSTHQGRLFSDILVVLNGGPNDQYAMDFGVHIAKLEGSKLFGLYISKPNNRQTDYRIGRYQKEFIQQCKDANVSGEIAITFANNPINQILRRAEFTNLVIYPFNPHRLKMINYPKLIFKCPTPIVLINGEVSFPLKKSLLAFNGSPKSNEALFISAFLSKFWEISLVVLSSQQENKNTDGSLYEAYKYLEIYNIHAEYIKSEGPPGIATYTFAIEDQCDIIILGGYSANTLKKRLSGSVVDEVLFNSKKPLLICK